MGSSPDTAFGLSPLRAAINTQRAVVRHRSTAEVDSQSAVADQRPQCLISCSRARRSRATQAHADSTGACPKGDVDLQRLTWGCSVNAVTKPHRGRSVGFSFYEEMVVSGVGARGRKLRHTFGMSQRPLARLWRAVAPDANLPAPPARFGFALPLVPHPLRHLP